MGDGWILPTELACVLDEMRVLDADSRDFYTRLVNSADALQMRLRKEKRELEREASKRSTTRRR